MYIPKHMSISAAVNSGGSMSLAARTVSRLRKKEPALFGKVIFCGQLLSKAQRHYRRISRYQSGLYGKSSIYTVTEHTAKQAAATPYTAVNIFFICAAPFYP